MLDLEHELDSVLASLDANGIEYALCGGLAMAVHGFPRATIDIDLLVLPQDEERIYAAVEPLGFTFRARPMHFDGGAMEIRRVSKIDARDGETLMLDLRLVTAANKKVWEERQRVAWRGRDIVVVSREGLIALKLARSSGTDLDDIKKLRGGA